MKYLLESSTHMRCRWAVSGIVVVLHEEVDGAPIDLAGPVVVDRDDSANAPAEPSHFMKMRRSMSAALCGTHSTLGARYKGE